MDYRMKQRVCVCQGKSCTPQGSAGLLAFLQQNLDAVKKIFGSQEVEVTSCECLGHCEKGPNISVNENVVNGVNPKNAFEKIREAKDATKKPIELDLDKLASEL